MGRTTAFAALAAGLLVALLTVPAGLGAGPVDLTQVAAAGLLVAAGACAVGFASSGTVRQLALAGAALAAVPSVVLGLYLAG